MRWVLLLMFVVILASCGGDDDAGEADNNPSEDPATEAPEDGDDADQSNVAGSTAISYSGPQSGEITDDGSCGEGVDGDGMQLFASSYDEAEDVTWMFQISIPEYNGQGEYEVGNSLLAGDSVTFNDTSITFSNNSGGEWGSTQENGGTVTVNDDETSGSVDATLIAADGSSEMHMSGEWACT